MIDQAHIVDILLLVVARPVLGLTGLDDVELLLPEAQGRFVHVELVRHLADGEVKLLRFVLPSIIMMIFTSIYSVVDGLFVSNFVGKTALAAINLTLPIIMGLSALGFMIGTGGSAIVARMLGEKKEALKNKER